MGVKWTDDSVFIDGANAQIGDKIMGLRSGENYKFDFPSDGIKDSNSNYLVGWTTTGAASTQYMDFSNGAVGTPSTITMTSATDANVSLDIVLKGTGVLDVRGLFTINGSTSLNGIIDDDTMATATATNVPTSESVVAYIAATPGGAGGTNTQIQYNNSGVLAGDSGFTTDGSGNLTTTGTISFANTKGIIDENSNNQLLFATTAGAANYLQIQNGATGDAPTLSVQGETNVDFNIQAAGTGNILFNGSDVICGDPGTEASGIDINGTTYNAVLKVSDIGGSNVAQFIMHRHSTTLQSLIVGARSNSNTSSHAAVTNGQSLFTIYGAGWTASHYDLFGAIDISADAAGTISSTSSPGRIRLQVTADGSNVPTTAVTISNDKSALFAGNVTIGSGSQTLQLNSSTAIDAVIDDDTMATAAATNVPTAESVVSYIASTAGGAGGSNTQIQYNNSGTLAGDSGFTTDGAGSITITGDLDVDNINIDGNAITSTSGDINITPTSDLNLDGVNWSSGLTNGQLFIGSTGNVPQIATLTAGTGISISNAAGSITISGGGGGYSWTEVTGTTQAMAVNNGYITNNAAQVDCTLPATASIGDTVIIQGKGAGGWKISQNAGQTIHFGGSDTTTGAGGSLESTQQYDSIELLCITANTDWAVLTAPQGTLTVT